MTNFFSRLVPALAAFAPLASAICTPRSLSNDTATDPVGGQTVSNTILVLARDSDAALEAERGLLGYGIPYQTLIVPKDGITGLPALNKTTTKGNFGGIVVVSELAYEYGGLWKSALTVEQLNELYNYQVIFGVRMVRLDVYPGPDFGTTTAIDGAGCCDSSADQLVGFSDTSAFPTANLKADAGISTAGLWHYPAKITNSSMAREVARFGPGGPFGSDTTAAVVNTIGGRQQMVFFTSWATSWSGASNYLQHAYIHWMTRGLFVGKRKTHLSAQIDDIGLATELYSPEGKSYRTTTGDLDAHVAWQKDLNKRLPAGSSFFLELAHNGNGDFIAATAKANAVCVPNKAIDYESPDVTPLEWAKPPGTGVDLWPAEWKNYSWSVGCAKLDSLSLWFHDPSKLNEFAHVSHTFSHMELNNATYHDAAREIYFNQAWFKQNGIAQARRFSAHGIVPPAITGLHNGDVIRAWLDNGIKYVVGDNTRAPLKNPNSPFWPLISTVEANGHAGLVIVPRYATTIYYNCDLAACTTLEWINTSGGKGDFSNLLKDARTTNSRNLLGLHPDPYMFHQANMRQTDVEPVTVGTRTGKHSLVMAWTETVAQEMARLTNWPIVSLGHDDIAQLFIDRMTLDQCRPNLVYSYSKDGKNIVSVTVSTPTNSCGVPVPVTVPGTGSASGGSAKADKVGSEPTIMWVTMGGSPVTINLGKPVAVNT